MLRAISSSRALLAFAALCLAGCGDDDTAARPDASPSDDATTRDAGPIDAGPPPVTLTFPEGFLFGTAIAGFQADMGCPTLDPALCEDRNSDWYAYITSPITLGATNTYLNGDPPSAGPGHYELFGEDIDRAANELSNNGLRLSIEWSRVFPTPTDGYEGYDALRGIANIAALDHYHEILALLRERGMTPLVTLNHYTLPSWIHDAVGCHENLDTCSPRGWVDKDRTVREIAKYAGFIAQELGGEVDLWATLNEPFAVLLPGYIQPSPDRTNPPAVPLALAEAKIVLVALIEAHARMYDAIAAADTMDADGDGDAAQIGVVYNMTPVKADDPTDPRDVQAAENVFYLFNMVYLNAVAKGELDDDLDGVAEPRDDLASRMDYLGINYYTRATVQGFATPALPELSPLSTFNPLTVQLWEDYPRGLYEMVMLAQSDFGLPTIITENGAPDPMDDGTAPSVLVRHMAWAARAIADGADLRGYFYWTLMDNYEWNHGMDMRFGLYAVDKDDPMKRRVARQAAATYAEIVSTRTITTDLQLRYPGP